MTWNKKIIHINSFLPPVICSVIPATPWTYGLGQKTESGIYLSPVNAITWLSKKLVKSTASGDIIIMMITENTHTLFMQAMNALTDVFPLPALTLAQRMAQSFSTLSVDKMQIPASADRLPAPSLLSVSTLRHAANAARATLARQAASVVPDADGLRRQVNAFIREQSSALADMENRSRQNATQQARAWIFQFSGNHRSAASEMMKDIPAPDAVHTAAIMFVADSLSELEGIIHEPDGITRP